MRASIDLGSNSALLTILDGDRIQVDRAAVVGLGKGLGDGGVFRDDRMEAALVVLRDYARLATEHQISPPAVAALTTSAARRATNADAFFARVQAETGLQFRVISGEEEAQRTFLGARSGLEVEGRVCVVDLGGGSTELAMGLTHPEWFHSHELGSVRLTEAVLGAEPRVATPADVEALRERVSASLDVVGMPGAPDVVVGVAGSVTTLMATELGLQAFDAQALHGRWLTAAMLAGFQDVLIGLDAEQRRAVFPLAPLRADYLLAATVVLQGVLEQAGESALLVSTRGLRFAAWDRLPAHDERQFIQ